MNFGYLCGALCVMALASVCAPAWAEPHIIPKPVSLEMGDGTFLQHVSRNHNDFGDWILEAYDEEGLANKIRKIKKKDKMLKVLGEILNKEKSRKIRKIVMPRRKKDVLRKLREMKNEM